MFKRGHEARLRAVERQVDDHDRVLRALEQHLAQIAARFAGLERKVMVLGLLYLVGSETNATDLITSLVS